jgi:hypothetical protein
MPYVSVQSAYRLFPQNAVEELQYLQHNLERVFEQDSDWAGSGLRLHGVSMSTPSLAVQAVTECLGRSRRLEEDVVAAHAQLSDMHRAADAAAAREGALKDELDRTYRRAAMRSDALEATRRDVQRLEAKEMALLLQVEFLQGQVRALQGHASSSSRIRR